MNGGMICPWAWQGTSWIIRWSSFAEPSHGASTGEQGSKHFPPSYSKVAEWKCSMRINKTRKEYGDEGKPGGKKYVSPPKPGAEKEWGGGRKPNVEQANRRGVQIKDSR